MALSQQVVANLLLLGFLSVGTVTSLIFKQQSICISMGKEYNHPFMQSMTMYIGELGCMLCFVLFKIFWKETYQTDLAKAEADGKATKINPLLLIIPTSCDFITSTLSFFAINLMPVSLQSMIRSGGLIVTTIFAVIFLKQKLYRQHLLGLTLIMTGLITVGLVVISDSQSQGDDMTKMIAGIILLICSFFTQSTQLIVEEKFFHQYHLNPFQVVGIEGFWGIIICGGAIAVFTYVPCPGFIGDDCLPNGNIEDVSFFFQQVFTMSGPNNQTPDQPKLLWMIILGAIGILFYNAISLAITKNVSSLARNVAQVFSPFFVWMGSLLLGWQNFLWGQLIGFLIITMGTMIFNEIIVLPFAGFNINTKKELAKKKLQEQLLHGSSNTSTLE